MKTGLLQIEWHTPPTEMTPPKGTLHVWRLIEDGSSDWYPKFWTVLSDDEKERAERFVFEKDRNMFVTVRGTLRFLLASYLSTPANNIEFECNAYGKPFICKPEDAFYQFNVSHSKNIAVIIVARQMVGIDVEYQDESFASFQIAERFFSKDEVTDLQNGPAHHFVERFFDCWCRKESYIKARGMGVSLPLESFATRSSGDGSALLLHSHHFPGDVTDMQIFPFSPALSFSGAITADKSVDSISYFDGNDFIASVFGEERING